MEKYNDDTILLFGKNKGKKLANIDASWFLWYEDAPGNKNQQLMEYIRENKVVLLQEIDLKKLKR